MPRCGCGVFSGLACSYAFAILEVFIAACVLMGDLHLHSTCFPAISADITPFYWAAGVILTAIAFTRVGIGLTIRLHPLDGDRMMTWAFAFPAGTAFLSVCYVCRLCVFMRTANLLTASYMVASWSLCPLAFSIFIFMHSTTSCLGSYKAAADDSDCDLEEGVTGYPHSSTLVRLTHRTFAMGTPAAVAAGVPCAEDATCLICLAAFEKDDFMKQLTCRHLFHAACIDRWIATCAQSVGPAATRCPMRCRPAGPPYTRTAASV